MSIASFLLTIRPDSTGATPLMLAAEGGHSDIMKWLLSKEADPSIKDNFGQSLLHYAARGTLSTLQLSLPLFADANIT